MATEQEIGVLAGQAAYLLYRVSRAEMIIDELKKQVTKDAFDSIRATVERKFRSLHPDSKARMKSVLMEIAPNVPAQQIEVLLSRLRLKVK